MHKRLFFTIGAIVAFYATSLGEGRSPYSMDAFVIAREDQINTAASGCLMICPAHAFGTPESAERLLRQMLTGRSSAKPSAVIICRRQQLATMLRFAPLVDQVVVSPFVVKNNNPGGSDDAIWADFDHPLINQLRELKRLAGRTALLAIIDIDGDPLWFGDRQAAFEEIEWQIFAAIGGGYRGLIWRGNEQLVPFSPRLVKLKADIIAESIRLAKAKPVKCAVATTPHLPVSALQSDSRLYVVSLNPNFMHLKFGDELTPPVPLPFENTDVQCGADVHLANGQSIVKAHTISGLEVPFTRHDDVVHISYRITGGGEMIVCDLSPLKSSR